MYYQYILLKTFLIFNRILVIAEIYINISNKESFLEHYEVIKHGRGDQIYNKAYWILLYLITPDRT